MKATAIVPGEIYNVRGFGPAKVIRVVGQTVTIEKEEIVVKEYRQICVGFVEEMSVPTEPNPAPESVESS